MTRAVVCGAGFDEAVDVLGLERVTESPDVVLVDLREPGAAERAAAIAPHVPRVLIAGPREAAIVRAAGASAGICDSAAPAALGPHIAAALPTGPRGATRVVLVTGPRGGAGRTLLACGLAERLARGLSVLVLDATGSGAAAWSLGLAPGPWSDLEGLVDELTGEHLAIVAAQRGRIRVVGGASSMPSVALLRASVRAGASVAQCVIVDAPLLFDDRTRALSPEADRVLVVSPSDPLALASLDGALGDPRVWLIASRCRADRIGEHPVVRSLPDDPGAVRAGGRGRGVGGALGRGYDELAELVAIDVA